MKRKHATSSVFAVLAVFACLGRTESKPFAARPNFVVMLCDNLGYGDVGCFGSKKHRTPNIDGLAATGIKLTSFYVTSGVCTPSRASFMTGCYPRRVGMAQTDPDGHVLRPVSPNGLHPDELTIAEVLKSRGYATACIGKWHLGDQQEFLPTRQGFDEYYGIPYSDDMTPRPERNWPPLPLMENETVVEAPAERNTLTKRYTRRAIEFITAKKEQPFFLYLAHAMPGSTKAPFASEAFRGKSSNGSYGDAVEEIDESTGSLLKALEKLGLEDRTVVVWTSDNGAPRGSRGSNLPLAGWGYTTMEGGMRVPCVVRLPGRVPAGTVSDELITSLDLLPTFAKLAGAEVPEDLLIDGKDVWPLLSGQNGARSPHEAFYYYHGDRLFGVRADEWKLHLPITTESGGNHRDGRSLTEHLLYDLKTDIGETTNVFEEHPDVVKRLLALAEKARRDLGDGDRPGRNQRPAGRVTKPRPRVLKRADIVAEGGESSAKKPVAPGATLEHFELAPGLRLELVAAEPEVMDPIEIAFDTDGRMWVVEMIDYPSGPRPGEPPKSRVRVLEDQDGDGRFETARTFADRLLFATGLQLWQGGAIVVVAGRAVYLRDTTGDGRADARETWFSGFSEENEQLRANHPRFALDNHIYVAGGLRGGTIVSHAIARNSGEASQKQESVSIQGSDLRFDPRTRAYEAVSGNGQFGLTFDDFGNRFVCSNRDPTKHVVLESRYIRRNPSLVVPSVLHNVALSGESARVFPLSKNWTNHSSHAGQFTSACGLLIYRGNALPPEYHGNSFVCEPSGNLVHREVLTPQGATFTSRPVRDGVEFLATPDDWFRPVNLAIGPDGALYVVDMYRAIIEHPHWLPEDMVEKLPFDAGKDCGRIYRIVAADHEPTERAPQAAKERSHEVVRWLEHPNSWWRDAAARLLYERQDRSVGRALEDMVTNSARPASRVRALWALAGLDVLTKETALAALVDPEPRVREQAVILAERWMAESPEILERVIALGDEKDARLRFQVALSLGERPPTPKIPTPIIEALKGIVLQEGADSWTRYAAMSSLPNDTDRLLEAVLADSRVRSAVANDRLRRLTHDLADSVGSHLEPTKIARSLAALAKLPHAEDEDVPLREVEVAVVTGLASGVHRRGASFQSILTKLAEEHRDLVAYVERIFARATSVCSDTTQPLQLRRECIDLLRYADFEVAGETVIRLVETAESKALRLHAIEVLATYHEKEIGPLLLAGFATGTPAIRTALLDAMLHDAERARLLLEEVAEERIRTSELSPTCVRRLTGHEDPGIREQAKKLLVGAMPAERKQVLKEYQKALEIEGDARRGRAVFEKNCAACHRISNVGVNVGPSIADFTMQKKPAVLLESILNPNRAIDANYLSYTVVTRRGETHLGVVAEETASSITLRQAMNRTVTVLRQDVLELRSNGVSLMPLGFEKNITVEQMADLIAFVRDWRFLDGLGPVGEGSE